MHRVAAKLLPHSKAMYCMLAICGSLAAKIGSLTMPGGEAAYARTMYYHCQRCHNDVILIHQCTEKLEDSNNNVFWSRWENVPTLPRMSSRTANLLLWMMAV